jgi:hypothetical protein
MTDEAGNIPRAGDSRSGGDEARDGAEAALVRLAHDLGNIALACRQLGVDRSAYYRALKRERDAQGVRVRSPLAKSVALEKKVIALCLEYPDWGCDRLAWYLTLKGDAISSPTAQKILIRHGLGKTGQRRVLAARLEEEGIRPAFTVP